MIKILKKNAGNHPRQWHNQLPYVSWVEITIIKSSTSETPIQLLYNQ